MLVRPLTAPTLSVIVLNYNTPELTRRCLDSIFQHTRGLDFEVILVDNGSTNCPPEQLVQPRERLKLVVSPENLGFAGGNNLGIDHSRGELLVLLNSDTVLLDNLLGEGARWLQEHERVGALSPRLDFPDGRPQSPAQRWPGLRCALLEGLRLQKVLPARWGRDWLLGSFCTHTRPVEADWIWGTCFFLPRRVLRELPGGRLDSRYFMYAEDMLWCWQIRQLGHQIVYHPGLRLIHDMGGSQGPKSAQMQRNTREVLEMVVPGWKRALVSFIQRLTGILP